MFIFNQIHVDNHTCEPACVSERIIPSFLPTCHHHGKDTFTSGHSLAKTPWLFSPKPQAVPPHKLPAKSIPVSSVLCLLQTLARLGTFLSGYLENLDLGLVKVIPIS